MPEARRFQPRPALLTEAPDGGWGLAGDANINAELAQGRPRRDSEPPARTGN